MKWRGSLVRRLVGGVVDTLVVLLMKSDLLMLTLPFFQLASLQGLGWLCKVIATCLHLAALRKTTFKSVCTRRDGTALSCRGYSGSIAVDFADVRDQWTVLTMLSPGRNRPEEEAMAEMKRLVKPLLDVLAARPSSSERWRRDDFDAFDGAMDRLLK